MVCFFIWGIMACSAYVVSHFSIRNWREQCFIRIWFLFLFFFLPPERAKGWPIFVLKKKGVHELMISLSYQWYGMGPYRHANELQCWTVNCSSFVCIVKKALTRQTQGQPFHTLMLNQNVEMQTNLQVLASGLLHFFFSSLPNALEWLAIPVLQLLYKTWNMASFRCML